MSGVTVGLRPGPWTLEPGPVSQVCQPHRAARPRAKGGLLTQQPLLTCWWPDFLVTAPVTAAAASPVALLQRIQTGVR